MSIIKKIITAMLVALGCYVGTLLAIRYAIDKGITNSESGEISFSTGSIVKQQIPPTNRIVRKYISEHPESQRRIEEAYSYMNGSSTLHDYRFPKNISGDKGFNFVMKGIKNRKSFVESVLKYSEMLSIDPDLVVACVLGEQIRISTKGARGDLKAIVMNSTPKLFRSYNVSLGIGGIKITTANQIKRDAIKYGYGDGVKYDIITSSGLSENDAFNGKYATYLIKNILTRWSKAGHDISDNPGVVCTLYNMGNDQDKKPNDNPKVGGSVIKIGGKNYVYGGISMGVYWYLKIYN